MNWNAEHLSQLMEPGTSEVYRLQRRVLLVKRRKLIAKLCPRSFRRAQDLAPEFLDAFLSSQWPTGNNALFDDVENFLKALQADGRLRPCVSAHELSWVQFLNRRQAVFVRFSREGGFLGWRLGDSEARGIFVAFPRIFHRRPLAALSQGE